MTFQSIAFFVGITICTSSLKGATISWNNPAGGSWNEASNWLPNQVPGPKDTAIIALEGTGPPLTVTLDANTSIGALLLGTDQLSDGAQALALNGKTLTLNGPMSVRENGRFNLDSGMLKGGENATVSGLVKWSGGGLNGTITLATNGLLVLAAAPDQTCELYGSLTNLGTVRLVSGELDLQGNYVGILVNLANGLVDLQTNTTIHSYNNRGTFLNWGTVRQSGGAGGSVILPRFLNCGKVDSQIGSLAFAGGGTMNDGSSFGGSAGAQLAGGTFAFSGTITGTNGFLTGAVVTGTNGVLVGNWIWTNGNVAAESTLTVGTNGVLTLAGAEGEHCVLYGILTNAGTVKLQSGTLLCQGNLQGFLINLAGGLIVLEADVSIHNYNDRGALVNFGTLRKSGGIGTSCLRPAFYNYGSVEVQTGTVSYLGPQLWFEDGSRLVGTGTNLFATGTVRFEGTLEARNLVLGGATIAGEAVLEGSAYWMAGRLEEGAVLTVGTNGSLELAGPEQKVLMGRLKNQGNILLSGTGRVALGSGNTMASIDNRPGAIFETTSDAPIAWTGFSQPAFTNAGVFRKRGAATTTLVDGVLVDNSGTLDVRSGTLAYTGSAMAFQDGSRFEGLGTNLLAAGSIRLSGSIYSENLELGGAAILGSNVLSGKVSWSKGAIEDGTYLSVARNGILVLSGSESKANYGVIDNYGAIFLYGTGTFALGAKTGPCRVYNRVGALFDLADDTPMRWTAFSTPTFTNTGTFRKSGGKGVALLDGILFCNSGTVDAEAGALAFNTSGSSFEDASQFIGKGTNVLAAGLIQLNGTITSENLELGGALITGTNTLRGSVYWSKGGIDDAGRSTVAPGATLQLGGPEIKSLTGALENLGTVRLTGTGKLAMGSRTLPAWINNRAGGVFEIASEAPLGYGAFAPPAFTNSGTLRKTGSNGITVVDSVIFQNSGTLDVESGTLAFNTSGSVFDEGSRFIGPGSNLLYPANISLNGALYSENLQIAGAAIQGTSRLSGLVVWTAGVVATQAVITVATNGILRLAGSELKAITGALYNEGLMQLTGTGTLAMGSQAGLAFVCNRPGGVFEAMSDAPLAWTAFGQPAFTNAGTFRKSAGTNMTLLNGVRFDNSGTVEVRNGTVGYSASGTAFGDGSRLVGRGTNLLLAETVALNGAIYSENLQIGGATVTGNSLLSGQASWRSGLIAGEGALTVNTNGMFALVGPDPKYLIGVLNNRGKILLAGTGTLGLGSQASIASLNNEPTGLFEVQSAAPIAWTGLSEPLFANAGRFRKMDDSTNVLSVPFVNRGTLDIQSGALVVVGTYALGGGKLNFGISGPANYGTLQFSSSAALTGTVGANLNGGYQPKAGDAFALVGYASRSGLFGAAELPSDAAWQTNYEAGTFRLRVLNARPLLGDPGLQSVDEFNTLRVSNAVTHADGALQNLSFSLVSAPPGVLIDTDSGTISWTPAQTQSPSTNTVSACVTDNGEPPLSATNSFEVVVTELNLAPVFSPIPTQTVYELGLFELTNAASEANLHSKVAYRLESPPPGMSISTGGVISWTPRHDQAPSTNRITTVATSANPYDLVRATLSATNQFTVIVYERPGLTAPSLARGALQFALMTRAGETYTLQYSVDLRNWSSKSTFEGYGGPLIIKDPEWASRPACFYRVRVGP